jgi:N-methylhydantoinase A
LRAEGFANFSTERLVEARYERQSHELLVHYHDDSSLRKSFDSLHRSLYGYATRDSLEVVNIKVKATVPRAAGELKAPASVGTRNSVEREAWVGRKTRKLKVFSREALATGSEGEGPCVIEEYDSTLVVNPRWKWRAEEYGTRLER